jgi:hypothetical protein
MADPLDNLPEDAARTAVAVLVPPDSVVVKREELVLAVSWGDELKSKSRRIAGLWTGSDDAALDSLRYLARQEDTDGTR